MRVLIAVLCAFLGTSDALSTFRTSAKVISTVAKRSSVRKKAASQLQRAGSYARSEASAGYREAPPAERRYWRQQWQSVEEELIQLEKAVGGDAHKVTGTKTSALQLTKDHPTKKAENSTVAVTTKKEEAPKAVSEKKDKVEVPKAASEKKVEVPKAASEKKETQPASKKEKELGKMLADATAKLNAGDKSAQAVLAPMLGMLKGIFQDAKSRIGDLNEREKKSKKSYEEHEARHKQRLADFEAKFKNHSISEEFYKNETRDENHMFKYWERARDLHHKQFHNMLKLTHGTMEKEKMMIDTYNTALAGKVPTNLEKIQKEVAPAMPEVVFVQLNHQVLNFCVQALLDVRKEIRSWAVVSGAGRA